MNFESFPQNEIKEKWTPKVSARLFIKRTSGQIEGDWTILHTDPNLITVFKPDPDNPSKILTKKVPTAQLEKLNNKNNLDFLEADNFNDLYKLIRFKNSLDGNVQKYSADTLIEIIEKVRAGKLTTKSITRTNNLRFAVEKLLITNQTKRI